MKAATTGLTNDYSGPKQADLFSARADAKIIDRSAPEIFVPTLGTARGPLKRKSNEISEHLRSRGEDFTREQSRNVASRRLRWRELSSHHDDSIQETAAVSKPILKPARKPLQEL